jgi:hypothetical protein
MATKELLTAALIVVLANLAAAAQASARRKTAKLRAAPIPAASS